MENKVKENWDTDIRILEERKDYKIFYILNSGYGIDFKYYFVMTVFLEYWKKQKERSEKVYYEYQTYTSKTVPVFMKEIEKDLRECYKKLIKRMKKDNE